MKSVSVLARNLKSVSLSLALSFSLGAGVARADVPATGTPVAAESGLVDALAQEHRVDATPGRADELAAAVRADHELLVAGEVERAATRLYLLVEGGRFSHLSGSDDFQNAEYDLGCALIAGGAVATGRRYLARLALREGSPYAAPALRSLVDVGLDTHEAAAAARQLDEAGIHPPPGPLAEEIDYLRGRARYEANDLAGAEDELKGVGPKCRFYSSAIYLRGVIAARRGDLKGASDAFCVIAEAKPGDPLRFVIDGRYFTVRDLARLALGRIAHEEGRYDDAFYHYFTIPSDSRELEHALFESAWSMLQKKDYALAARLVDELVHEFPRSPLAGEALLLRATLHVKTCRFGQAAQEFDRFLRDYEPVARALDEARRDPAARRALARRLLEQPPTADGVDKAAPAAMPDSTERRLRRLLAVDPAFYRVAELVRGLRGEADGARQVESAWSELARKLAGTQVAGVASDAPLDDTIALLDETRALGQSVAATRDLGELVQGGAVAAGGDARKTVDEELAKLAELEARRAKLEAALTRAAVATVGNAPAPAATAGGTLRDRILADHAAVATQRARAEALVEKLDRVEGELLGRALDELGRRLPGMIRQAELGKVDAVVGEKRRLEKQIQDLAAGRFPPEMASRLHIEGLIGDDEEYWPPEKEHWADEYEGYK